MEQSPLMSDSPDESRLDVNVRAFPAFPQDRRAALTAVSVPGALSAVEQPDLAVFLGTCPPREDAVVEQRPRRQQPLQMLFTFSRTWSRRLMMSSKGFGSKPIPWP